MSSPAGAAAETAQWRSPPPPKEKTTTKSTPQTASPLPHPKPDDDHKAAGDALLPLQPKELNIASQLLHQNLIPVKIWHRGCVVGAADATGATASPSGAHRRCRRPVKVPVSSLVPRAGCVSEVTRAQPERARPKGGPGCEACNTLPIRHGPAASCGLICCTASQMSENDSDRLLPSAAATGTQCGPATRC